MLFAVVRRIPFMLRPPEFIFLLHFRVFSVEVIALFNHYQQTNRCQNIFKHDLITIEIQPALAIAVA